MVVSDSSAPLVAFPKTYAAQRARAYKNLRISICLQKLELVVAKCLAAAQCTGTASMAKVMGEVEAATAEELDSVPCEPCGDDNALIVGMPSEVH